VETPAALATCFMVARLFVFISGASLFKISTIVIVPDNDNIVTNPGRFVKWFFIEARKIKVESNTYGKNCIENGILHPLIQRFERI
jgi:hypothetical protein